MVGGVNPELPLELLNGAGMVLETCFLGLMVLYLLKETKRRGLGVADWIGGRLPPSMNFALAVMVCDSGVWLRSIVVWSWRRFYDGGGFGNYQLAFLALGALAIVVGSLCKIRAITKPDHGNGPWLASAAAVLLFVVVTVLYR